MEAGHGFAPSVNVEFLVNAVNQRVDRVKTEIQTGGDFLVALAAGEQAQHLEFAVANSSSRSS